MVVMILAAFLVKSRQRRLLQWVWVGVLAALAVTVGAFLIIHFGTKTLTSLGQELVGGISSLIAVGLVSYLLLWMRGADKNMSRVLNDKMETAAASGPLAVIVLAFTAVAREGIETALLVFDTFAYGDTVKPALGLSVGIAIAIVVTLLMYRGAIRINLSIFFRITGVLLIVVAAGILRYGINDLQEAGVLPGLNTLAFNVADVIPPGSPLAVFLEGMFNLVPAPTLLSMIAWAIYLIVALWLFLRPLPAPSSAQKGTSTNA